ncbi:MAG TPA: FAD-dependent oxidoreductase, partial [Dehalococcoidia bacterium]|nr:FAD-dependent oxidoreductase [Dehalococcoidia bacterium]
AYSDRLRGTTYQDSLCLVISLKQPLTKYYWLNINDRTLPFLAVIEHTNLIEAKRYGGQHIVYLSTYVGRDSELLGMSESELFSMYVPHLKRINAGFDESRVNSRWRFHGPNAQPVFTIGSGSRIAGHRTPVPGLYLANMAQIYPQDRGQNYSILLGETIAEMVGGDLLHADAPQYQV